MTRDQMFLELCANLQAYPKWERDMAKQPQPRLTHIVLHLADGFKWIETWLDNSQLRKWSWIAEQFAEEFNCRPDDVDCVQTDDGDKIAVRGKIVGYVA